MIVMQLAKRSQVPVTHRVERNSTKPFCISLNVNPLRCAFHCLTADSSKQCPNLDSYRYSFYRHVLSKAYRWNLQHSSSTARAFSANTTLLPKQAKFHRLKILLCSRVWLLYSAFRQSGKTRPKVESASTTFGVCLKRCLHCLLIMHPTPDLASFSTLEYQMLRFCAP